MQPNRSNRTSRPEGKWPKIRKFFNDVHLWSGLISGVVVIVVCFSGTIYTYNTELRELAAPHLHRVAVPAGAERLPADSLVAVAARLAGGRVTAVSLPADASRSVSVTVRVEGDQSRFGTTYYLDPYTGAYLGDSKTETGTDRFMGFLFSLHRWLLLDKIEKPLVGELPNRTLGSYITGTATILFTLGVITGLVIWFPKKLRNWRQGLRIKWNASWKRINHDLHNTLAFYSLIFLFLMGITGPQWSFPWYREGLQKALGTYREAPAGVPGGRGEGPRGGEGRGGREQRESQSGRGASGGRADGRAAGLAGAPAVRGGGTGGGERPAGGPEGRRMRGDSAGPEENTSPRLLPLAQYLAAADAVLPYRGDYRITLPSGGDTVLSLTKNRVGFFAPAAGDQVKVSIASASVTEVSVFRDKPLNERIAGSIKALHVGNVYGQFTKLLYFLACLIATSLPVTGTLIWINKMKKKPASRRRKMREPVAG